MENRIGVIFQADDGAMVKVYQKDALNEGCVHCHFFLPEAEPGTRCGVKQDKCYVTYISQSEPRKSSTEENARKPGPDAPLFNGSGAVPGPAA